MDLRWLAAGALLVGGCARAAPAAAPAPPTGERFELSFAAGTTNLSGGGFDADAEHVDVWRRDEGDVVYVSALRATGSCHPSVTLFLPQGVAAEQTYALGSEARMFLEEQCGDGSVKSWTAAAGAVRVFRDAFGTMRLCLVDVQLAPGQGAVGGFEARGFLAEVALGEQGEL
jgi:hypothetical protein